jgi:beta-N-acetylhexosaminidase
VTLSLDEAIGSLIMVGVRGARPEDEALERDLDACAEARVGGVILFDRDLSTGGPRNIEGPAQLADLVAHLRARLGEHLLVAIDQEGGAVARLRPDRGFGATASAAELSMLTAEERRERLAAMAAELAGLGIDLDFAPCVDLALDPHSSIIAARGRSFGSDLDRVVSCAQDVLSALHTAGVAGCAKHFPGHGSARGDTHAGLVDITGAHEDSEVEVYRRLLAGAEVARPRAIMTGHLLHRGIDADLPASLSPAWTTGVLRGEVGFAGVVVTDSLDMGAIADRWPAGEAAALAVIAGADLVLEGVNLHGPPRACPVPEMAAAIRAALHAGRIPGGEASIVARARRVRALRPSSPR